MSKNFGIPYMGSKSKLATDILQRLPSGSRFVDLFGGGAAMTHAALLSKKYKKALYCDINSLLVELIKKAANGNYNYSRFRPEFITHEQFDNLKNIDGYVKYIWSFGNDGKSYMFSREIEPYKKAAHDFIVFGKHSEILDRFGKNLSGVVKSNDIKERRLQFRQWLCLINKRFDLQQLQQLERLQQLEQLQQLQQLQRLETVCQSYLDYQYLDGDIVYCDPPYEGTADYGDKFDHKKFYDWVFSRDFQVWFSSYQISDKRFKMIWARKIRGTKAGGSGAVYNYECLYTNKG